MLCSVTSCEPVEPEPTKTLEPHADCLFRAYVWEDSDGNGRQTTGEPPMAGVVIQIVDPSMGYLQERSETRSGGGYSSFFAGCDCGQCEYDAYLSVPGGYWPTTPVVVNIESGSAQFGLRLCPDCGPLGDASGPVDNQEGCSFSIHVWQRGGYGTLSATRSPMAGGVVQVVDSSSGLLRERARTGSDGDIQSFFAGASCEQYDVYLSVPDGYWPISGVKMNSRSGSVRFGLRPYP